MDPIGKQLNNYQVPSGSSSKASINQPPIGTVDRIAKELVTEYSNLGWLKWYCGVIYEFGLPKVEEWRSRASEGNSPAMLFSHYVSQARKFNHAGDEVGSHE